MFWQFLGWFFIYLCACLLFIGAMNIFEMVVYDFHLKKYVKLIFVILSPITLPITIIVDLIGCIWFMIDDD